MDVKWSIRKFRESDRPVYLDWRKLVAHRNKSPDFVEWEYYSNPYGAVDTWVADDNGQIVGQYSLQGYDSYFFGMTIRASLCFDVATHPDYRFQGMFTRLGHHALKAEGENDVAFTVGFPWVGGIAIPGHMKVGWKQLGALSIYYKTEFDDQLVQDSGEIKINGISTFDQRFDNLAEARKNDLPVALVRNQAYLNWRFVHKVGYTYYPHEILEKGDLVGYIVLKLYESDQGTTLHIIDFLLPKSEDVFQRTVGFVFEKARELKVDKVNLVINENHHFYPFLESIDFQKEERHFIPIVHRNNDSVDEEKLMDFKNYHLTMGDNDIF
ncbi:MAG: GNAT family N-acetyltransferase [Candidatus Thorarchaeota archaeon]|jgi:hypothetical protein